MSAAETIDQIVAAFGIDTIRDVVAIRRFREALRLLADFDRADIEAAVARAATAERATIDALLDPIEVAK